MLKPMKGRRRQCLGENSSLCSFVANQNLYLQLYILFMNFIYRFPFSSLSQIIASSFAFYLGVSVRKEVTGAVLVDLTKIPLKNALPK